MNHRNFGPNLRTLMNVLDMNQLELAEKSGITPAGINQILQGNREPSLKTICKILAVIPCTFERLVKEEIKVEL